jgi:hypothetical protein
VTVIVIIVLAASLLVSCTPSEGGGTTETTNEPNVELGCKMTATALAFVAEAIAEHLHAAEALSEFPDAVAEGVCVVALKTWLSNRDLSAKVGIITANGTQALSLSQVDFLHTAAAPSPTTCADWLLQSYRLACYGGQMGPPLVRFTPEASCSDWVLSSFRDACFEGTIGPPTKTLF